MNDKPEDLIYKLLNSNSSRLVADRAVEIIGDNQLLFDLAFDYTLNSSYPINMRAARVIMLAGEKHPCLFNKYLPLLTQIIIHNNTEGVKRNILKAIIDYLNPLLIPDFGELLNFCFSTINSHNYSPAIRVYSIFIIEKYIEIESDLEEELINCLELIDEYDFISLKTVSKAVLKRLNAKKKGRRFYP